jgi:transposase
VAVERQAKGVSYRQIAERLKVSKDTVQEGVSDETPDTTADDTPLSPSPTYSPPARVKGKDRERYPAKIKVVVR